MVAAAGALEMTGGQRAELERLARSHTAPAREVRQAKALLWATDGVSNAEIARRCASTPKSVRRWRSRFAAEGTAAVGRIRAGRGRPVVLGDDVVEAVVHDTLHTVPEDGSACWSTRLMAARHGIGKDTVARIWQARRIRPWKVETFKLSTDPSFESKLRDVVGLYVNPPAAAAVFCFDEKTQVQAMDRTQPSLPMVPGRAGTMTHDYKRNGTLDLFAALNVGSGEVLHDTRRSHTGRRLAQTRRRDPRQSRPRTSHPRPDHQIRNTTSRPSEPSRDSMSAPRHSWRRGRSVRCWRSGARAGCPRSR
jgi:transposase